MPSFTVENYLKTIYHLSRNSEGGVSTNAIAESIGTKAATVTDMLKKLSTQKLVSYKKYKGTMLTESGRETAVNIIRKHRLWEVFLMEKLGFGWDEVHDIAEELEHVPSDKLVDRLEEYLDYPKFDPHGDPIPDREGNINRRAQVPLTQLEIGAKGEITGVRDTSSAFLRYLDAQNVQLGDSIEVTDIYAFDHSRIIKTGEKTITMSRLACENLFVTVG